MNKISDIPSNNRLCETRHEAYSGPPNLDSWNVIEAVFHELVPQLNQGEIKSLRVVTSNWYEVLNPASHTQKAAEKSAKNTRQNWQFILKLLEVEGNTAYLNEDEFVNALTNYLVDTWQDLDYLTSDLLEIQGLAQDLGLREELEIAFQEHLDLLRAKKDKDLCTFWKIASQNIEGAIETIVLHEDETYESALTGLLKEHQEEISTLNLKECNLAFLPKGIGNLSQLQTLTLINNQLTALPLRSIRKLKNLEFLLLMTNPLPKNAKVRDWFPGCSVGYFRSF